MTADWRSRTSWLTALVTSLSASAVLSASGRRPVDVPSRIQGAGKAVVATVMAVNAEWRQNAHGDRLIVSRVRLGVEETLKGGPASELWMDLEGGTLDGF